MNKIFLAGHNGLVGSSFKRKIVDRDFKILGDSAFLLTQEKTNLNLERQDEVEAYFGMHKPDYVIIAAAKVGGIRANDKYRAEFIYRNIQIQNNLIHSSYLFGVKKLLFLGSSCIYPKFCQQPMKEEYLLTGELEKTNEPYAVAKISGIKMCESYYNQYGCNFISVMPTNLYGPNDNYDLEKSHVIPALIRKFHEAKEKNQEFVEVWGSGKARREFMYVDDMTDACLNIFDSLDAENLYSQNISHLNIGTGEDITIRELAEKIKKVVGFNGDIVFNTSNPDGPPVKLLDISKMIQYKSEFISLEHGLQKTYKAFKSSL